MNISEILKGVETWRHGLVVGVMFNNESQAHFFKMEVDLAAQATSDTAAAWREYGVRHGMLDANGVPVGHVEVPAGG